MAYYTFCQSKSPREISAKSIAQPGAISPRQRHSEHGRAALSCAELDCGFVATGKNKPHRFAGSVLSVFDIGRHNRSANRAAQLKCSPQSPRAHGVIAF